MSTAFTFHETVHDCQFYKWIKKCLNYWNPVKQLFDITDKQQLTVKSVVLGAI